MTDESTRLDLEEIKQTYVEDLKNNNLTETSSLYDVLQSKCKLSTKSIRALEQLISNIPNGEMRPQQMVMIARMSDIIETNNDGLLQAGTGVGKSIAYLIPAIISKRKCFISTSTKQLTSQLVEKDLPLLKKYLFPSLEFIGLQSLSNYICPKKMTELVAEQDADAKMFEACRQEEYKALKKVVPKYQDYLAGIIKPEDFTIEYLDCDCSSFQCAGSNCVRACAFEGKGECPVQKIISKVASSNVVVTNHALVSRLLVSASRETDKKLGILKYRYLWICDEAHDLEGYLEKAFSSELSTYSLQQEYVLKLEKYLNSSSIPETFSANSSKYFATISSAEPPIDPDLTYSTSQDILDDIKRVGLVLGSLLNMWRNYQTDAQVALEIQNTGKKYPDDSIEKEFEFEEKDINAIRDHIGTLAEVISRLDTLECINVKYIPTVRKLVGDLHETLRNFNLAYTDRESYITYYTYHKTGDEDMFKIQSIYLPVGDAVQSALGYLDLDKSDLLKENENKINMIGVSATLCVDGGFRDMADKLGMLKLKDVKCFCHDVGTVFDYKKQGLLYIPQNIPDTKRDRREHLEYFKENVRELIELSHGGALILCTSKENTTKTYQYLLEELGDKYNILSAEDKKWKNKNKLVEAFRDDVDSVLIGTRGFFQGLDVQGESLRLLCLDKIPFPNPSVLTDRKGEIAKSKGLSGFRVTSIVPATMLMLQAIGRLIRHTSDRGVVAIFDNRLYSGEYWIAPMVRSIPPFSAVDDIKDVEEFFNNMNS